VHGTFRRFRAATPGGAISDYGFKMQDDAVRSSDARKPWDERLVERMSYGSDTAHGASGRRVGVGGFAGIATAQLGGHVWYWLVFLAVITPVAVVASARERNRHRERREETRA
jgi:hypothetical protein